MDIGKAFSFVTEDERWLSKILIGGLVFFIPIAGQLVWLGYMLKVAQNVVQGNPRPLPEWNEFSDLLVRGVYGFIISLVYQIPTILLYCIFIAIAVGAGASADGSDTSNAMAGITGLVTLCLFPIMFILALIGALLSYAGMARYVATNNLSDGLQVGAVFALLRANLGPFVVLALVVILAGIAASFGYILLIIGALFTSFYAQCVSGHALGQTIQRIGLGNPSTPPTSPFPPSYQ